MSKIEKKYTTNDLALAGYLKLKGLKLLECEKGDKFIFVFDDSNDVAESLAVEFINSDIRRFDDEIRSLKKLLYNK